MKAPKVHLFDGTATRVEMAQRVHTTIAHVDDVVAMCGRRNYDRIQIPHLPGAGNHVPIIEHHRNKTLIVEPYAWPTLPERAQCRVCKASNRLHADEEESVAIEAMLAGLTGLVDAKIPHRCWLDAGHPRCELAGHEDWQPRRSWLLFDGPSYLGPGWLEYEGDKILNRMLLARTAAVDIGGGLMAPLLRASSTPVGTPWPASSPVLGALAVGAVAALAYLFGRGGRDS